MRLRQRLLPGLAAVAYLTVSACTAVLPAPASPTAPTVGPDLPALRPAGATETASVLRVTDGDTIVVDRGRGDERVRYIGIDAPEMDAVAGDVARDGNVDLVDGREVVLERDASETDRFGRLLRHVWLRDGDRWTLVNLELVRRGLVDAKSYPPDTRHDGIYADAEAAARAERLGIWAAAAAPSATPLGVVGGSSSPRDGCDPAYPTVCIPPSPPDLDCADVEFRDFAVLPPDPHRFDRGGDGLGCEND